VAPRPADRRSTSIAGPATPALRRVRARRGEGERLRQEILAATERLLLQTGDSDAVSIRAVAEAVGVTPPSIYLHFADKSDLVFAVCEEHFARFEAAASLAVQGVDDPLERIYRRGQAYVQFGLDNPEHYRIMFMSRAADAPSRLVDEGIAMSAAFSGLVDDVRAAVERGEIDGDPFVIACGTWAAVHGVTSLIISKPHFPWPPIDEMLDHTLVVCSRARGGRSGPETS
jgi:AcrR family transcriptional regulator